MNKKNDIQCGCRPYKIIMQLHIGLKTILEHLQCILKKMLLKCAFFVGIHTHTHIYIYIYIYIYILAVLIEIPWNTFIT